jgi:hypothetical protein
MLGLQASWEGASQQLQSAGREANALALNVDRQGAPISTAMGFRLERRLNPHVVEDDEAKSRGI